MAYEIELLVPVQSFPEDGLDNPENAIAARLAGTGKWGSQEIKFFQRVRWPAPGAPAEQTDARDLLVVALNKKAELGEVNPVVMYPFQEVVEETPEDDNGDALLDIEGAPLVERNVTSQSIVQINFDALSDADRNKVMNPGIIGDPILIADVALVVEEKGLDKRNPEDRRTKAGREAGPNAKLHADEDVIRRDADLAGLLAKEPKRPRG